jgi:hypothetical protein
MVVAEKKEDRFVCISNSNWKDWKKEEEKKIKKFEVGKRRGGGGRGRATSPLTFFEVLLIFHFNLNYQMMNK